MRTRAWQNGRENRVPHQARKSGVGQSTWKSAIQQVGKPNATSFAGDVFSWCGGPRLVNLSIWGRPGARNTVLAAHSGEVWFGVVIARRRLRPITTPNVDRRQLGRCHFSKAPGRLTPKGDE